MQMKFKWKSIITKAVSLDTCIFARNNANSTKTNIKSLLFFLFTRTSMSCFFKDIFSNDCVATFICHIFVCLIEELTDIVHRQPSFFVSFFTIFTNKVHLYNGLKHAQRAVVHIIKMDFINANMNQIEFNLNEKNKYSKRAFNLFNFLASLAFFLKSKYSSIYTKLTLTHTQQRTMIHFQR